ncbi:MAG TPA: hypothetical protein VEJ43_16935 [Pseudolabrys sp.]|nr:hypothetical protein [Pseudolabrys sp.]
MNDEQFEKLLASALKRDRQASQADELAVERVLKRLSGPLPRQKQPLWRLPGVLLDWQFAPAWPRMAALACCLAVGFAIGLTGVDRSFEGPGGAPAFVGGGGIGSITFEPDAFTGGRP